MEKARGFTLSPNGSTELVNRIFQVALGLFVTTTELQHLNSPPNGSHSYDCTFDEACYWSSVGSTTEHWKLAKGEPDPILWFAATGTMQLPKQPFALIEVRGQPADQLSTELIECHDGPSALSFTYWATGGADVEICLTDQEGTKFNCTGMLQARSMPGKVSLKIPPVEMPFHVSISANSANGIIALDDIKYDTMMCQLSSAKSSATTPTPDLLLLWTESSMSLASTSASTKTSRPNIASSTREPPFNLLIIGNKTKPLFDRRRGRILSDASKLICDFGNEFPCLWGVESGRWALINKGAIPSMESSERVLPTFPAAVVLQGEAMFTSDPLKCQTGPGKLLFRYWNSGAVNLRVCALRYGIERSQIDCFMPNRREHSQDDDTLAVFNLLNNINEPFTLNIIPEWEPLSTDRYLVIDEIAYIGECDMEKWNKENIISAKKLINNLPAMRTTMPTIQSSTIASRVTSLPLPYQTVLPSASPLIYRLSTPRQKYDVIRTNPSAMRSNTVGAYTRLPHPLRFRSTVSRKRLLASQTAKPVDYCFLLNCNFEVDACNYMNHGLTKAPWTLRTHGYGNLVTKFNDIRQSSRIGQFVSALLSPGDFAILESPKFNTTTVPNVLLFQYFRPSHFATIRLCLDTRYSQPYLTTIDFTQCPAILRTTSTATMSAHKWNNIRVQLPPGTTQFFLVAHNLEKSTERLAIGIDNIRLAVCDAHVRRINDLVDFYDSDRPND
ncbi:hypothetical protein Tcan_07686 [Toxocara canis]|uniref:MAM domain-containing protein n=1 Tax=Toxocara canis TaxID=6265 RepID=A0A0B2VQ50_TOXCA|nr:hypothetical protein Tcan_07686 [Toxocara canis]